MKREVQRKEGSHKGPVAYLRPEFQSLLPVQGSPFSDTLCPVLAALPPWGWGRGGQETRGRRVRSPLPSLPS